jgi:hypothetical protein
MAAFQFPKIRVAILNAETPSRKAAKAAKAAKVAKVAKITLDYTFIDPTP